MIREDKDPQIILILLKSLKSKKNYLYHLIPTWLVSFVLAIFSLLFVTLLNDPAFIRPIIKLQITSIPILLVAISLFIIRDACMLLWIHTKNPRHNRNEVTFLFYLICIYGLIPICFLALKLKIFLIPFWGFFQNGLNLETLLHLLLFPIIFGTLSICALKGSLTASEND